MSNAVVARQQGDDYQARCFWVEAAKLFDPAHKVRRVGFEISGQKAFDDVAVWYSSPVPDDRGGTVMCDFLQVKYHVVNGDSLTWESLHSPEDFGGSSISILQRLRNAVNRCVGDGIQARFIIVTPWPIASDDPLGKFVSNKNGEIRLDKLFDGTGDRSATGRVRKAWRTHLGIATDEELRTVLSPLRFRTNHGTLQQLRDRMGLMLSGHGFKSLDASALANLFDDLIRKLHAEGRREFSRDELQSACEREGLWVGVGQVTGTGLELSSLTGAMRAASAALLSWPTDLGHGEWLPRPELNSVLTRIRNAPHSTSLLLGGPGCGKSAFLAKLGQQLSSDGVTVLAIKADLLPDNVRDANSLATHLGLPSSAETCLRRLAANGKVVLLIDQLDALAALVDLRTARLNALLNLVRELDDVANVHVVCSCREFERRRDARLVAIEAEIVELSLPTWEAVAPVLQTRGVVTEGWPEPFRELLRPPQHLKVFLQGLVDPTEPRIFGSYQQMLDDLWAKRVTDSAGPAGRSELVLDLATAMGERESLWVPVILFEDRLALIEHLIGMEVLTRGGSGTSVGFSHQTLFEHAWARAFARQKSRLSDYAVARQNGLFIRPTVWASLNYLRGADSATYRQEFSRLWSRSDLRPHLRHLLLEFLGTVTAPELQEQAWLFGALSHPALRSRVLASVRGNLEWFRLMADGHLSSLMRGDSANASLLVGLLAAALPHERGTCLRLIRDEWADDSERALLAFNVLVNLTAWDEDSVTLACQVIRCGRVNRSSALHLATQVQASASNLAPRIVASAFDREIQELEAQPDPPPDPLPDDATEADKLANRMTHRPRRRFERLIDDSNNWYGVEGIAEQAPAAFLQVMWPLFTRAIALVTRDATVPNRFRRDYTLGVELPAIEKESSQYPLAEAVDLAVCSLASSTPSAFVSFLNANRGADSDTIQRFLARGLAAGVVALHTEAFQFLIEDHRRLQLGPHSDEYQETVCLLQALAPYLSGEQVRQLEAAILAWNWVEPDSERHDLADRFKLQRYNRRRRLRLLKALPNDRLSPESLSLIAGEAQVFPDHREAGVHRIEGGWIGSSMSADQMKRARDEHIVGLFRKLHDATHTTYPTDFLVGGSVQASREFEAFAEAEPNRAVRILADFQPGQQERPAGAALVGIAKSNFPSDELFRLVSELDARGFCTEEFRIDAGRAIETRAREPGGLPDDICELLEGWLADPWTVHEPAARDEKPNERGPSSVLWGGERMVPIPQGTHTLLECLACGYLLRKPMEADRWLAALTAHVEREDSAATWRSLSRVFADLRFCTREAVVCFVNRLFERFPSVLASDEGAILVTRLWHFAPPEVVWIWLDQLRRSTWEDGRQAFGELVVLRAILLPTDTRATEELSALLNASGTAGGHVVEERVGVALACAHLWDDREARDFTTDVFTRLLPTANDRVAGAALEVVSSIRELQPDSATHAFLDLLVRHSHLVAFLSDGGFVEHLADLLPNEAEAVFLICRELVRLRRGELGSIQSGWAVYASHMTNIAITLQRMEGELRDFGVELFELLLEGSIPDAESALREIDQRIPTPLRGVMPRPRRRSKRRRAAQQEQSIARSGNGS